MLHERDAFSLERLAQGQAIRWVRHVLADRFACATPAGLQEIASAYENGGDEHDSFMAAKEVIHRRRQGKTLLVPDQKRIGKGSASTLNPMAKLYEPLARRGVVKILPKKVFWLTFYTVRAVREARRAYILYITHGDSRGFRKNWSWNTYNRLIGLADRITEL